MGCQFACLKMKQPFMYALIFPSGHVFVLSKHFDLLFFKTRESQRHSSCQSVSCLLDFLGSWSFDFFFFLKWCFHKIFQKAKLIYQRISKLVFQSFIALFRGHRRFQWSSVYLLWSPQSVSQSCLLESRRDICYQYDDSTGRKWPW